MLPDKAASVWVRLGTSEKGGEEEGKVPDGPGHLGKGCRVLPGVSLSVDECGAEEEIEVAGETGSLDSLTWGGVRGVHQ